MKIKNLKINGFGKLENKEIEFSDGINIISGKNESGKSTLLKFITSMLYGTSKNKNGKKISDYDKFKPWTNADYSGKIEYQLDNGNKYEIFREFKKKSPIIYNENKEDISKEFQVNNNKENAFFVEQTGITQENFFSTFVSEQENVKLSDNMKNAVIQKLSNMIATGNENISYKKAIDKINKSQLENIGSSRSTGRPINIIDEKIEKLEKEIKDINIYENQKYKVEESKQDLKNNLQENKNVLNLLRKQKINLEKEQIENEKINILKKDLNQDIEEKEKLESKIRDNENNKKEAYKSNKITYFLLTISIVLLTVLGTIFNKLIYILDIIPLIAIIIVAKQNNKNKKEYKRHSKRVYQENREIEEKIEIINKRATQKRNEVRLKQEQADQEKKKKNREIIDEFSDLIEMDIIQDILSTKYEKIVEFIDEKEREQTEFKIAEKTIEIDNENTNKKIEDLVNIEEELDALYEKKDELNNLNSAYEIAKQEIENSYKDMKENITPEFMDELKNIISKITNGKYTEVYLDSDNNILVENEQGKYVTADNLSTGTIDLIYLALRISACKEICKENMPIILDESFAYYDTERMTKILKYLSQINNQILVLTCSEREINILNNIGTEYKKIEI